jgi:hypothetical protein
MSVREKRREGIRIESREEEKKVNKSTAEQWELTSAAS